MKDNNWNALPLGELVTIQKGKISEQSTYPEEGFTPIINTDALRGDIKVWGKIKGSVNCIEEDVLILWDGERSGLCAIGYKGVLGSTFAKMNVSSELVPEYLFRVVDFNFDWIQGQRTGTGVPHVPKDLKTIFKVNFPPLPQQKKIAKILSTVDTVIAQTETAIAKYQAIKQGLMHDLFTRGIDVNTGLLRPTAEEAPALYKESSLGLIPKDWEEITFGYEINFLSGCPFSSAFFNEEKRGLPLIRIRDLINSSQETYYNGAYSDSYLINEGDVLIGMDGDFHIVKWNNSASLLNQRILKISEKRDGKLYLDYFFYYLFPFLLDVHNKTAATTVKHLSTKDISDAKRFMPLKPEQILSAKKILSVDQKIQTEQQALAKYQQLKAGLLQDLLTGKVEVTVD